MDKLFDKIIEVANNRNIHIVKSSTVKGAAACTAISFFGGLIGGPIGLVAGGVLGGLTAYGISLWENSKC